MIDCIKKMFSGAHFFTLIYLILNVALITAVLSLFLSYYNLPGWAIPIVGFLVYVCSAALALSPIGESLIRWKNGCKLISDPDIEARIVPLFNEVYAKAKEKEPGLPDDVTLYMAYDNDANAFAVGRKSICFHTGLLNATDDEIKGVLAHEFGHLAHKDTILLMLVVVGNLFVTLFTTFLYFINILIKAFGFVVGDAFGEGIEGFISGCLIAFVNNVLIWGWTKLGVVLLMASSRKDEFEADRFSAELGYARGLCGFLYRFTNTGATGLFAILAASHPDSGARVAALAPYLD